MQEITTSPLSREPEFDFFRGRSMRIVYPSSPGAFPIESVAQKIGAFLGADVTVDYIMENGTVGGTNAGACAPSDGLTIGVTSIGGSLAALLTGPNQFDFDFKDLRFLGAVGNSPSVLVSSRPELTSLEQLIHGKQQVSFVAFPNSRQLISSEMLATMFEMSASMLTGYHSSGAAAAACQRGEGDVAVIALDQILNADNSRVVEGFTPLLRMGDAPTSSKTHELSQQIPSIASYVAAHPFTTAKAKQAYTVNHNFSDSSVPAVAFFAPPGTQESRYRVLAQAVRHTFEDHALAQELADKTVSSTLIQPDAIAAWLESTIDTHGPFIQGVASTF